MQKLVDKIILLTGGSGLLGKAIHHHLQVNGAFVINADVETETTQDLTSINCDITNEESIKSAINKILEKFGRIDGLINNAYPRTPDWGKHFEDIPYSSWKSNVDFQLNSYFLLAQTVLRSMRENKKGSIVNMSSIYGVVGPDFSVYADTDMTMPAAYSAIKGGLINFSRYLAAYYGPYNIRVNCVSPGGVFNHQPQSFVDRYEEKVPLRRMAKPNDIAPAVTFLLSDESSYITGQNIIVDGGWTSI